MVSKLKTSKIPGKKEGEKMSTPYKQVALYTNTGRHLTPHEEAFITAFIACKNIAQAVVQAGYKSKKPAQYGQALLAREYISEEISYRIKQMEDAKTAKATEVMQFYTSVMRGELLDQFGIEASLDTRIKAANELAKHLIEIPAKLQQKELSNNVGSVTLNFLPRKDED